MKALEFGQKFICFNFVIEDGKRVINLSEVMLEVSAFDKILFFKISNKDVNAGPSGDPIATLSVCSYRVLSKLNLTENVALFINSTNTSFRITDWESHSS